jgi:hypothetical protein
VVLFEVLANALQVRGSGWCPADTHVLRAQHLFQASVHFFLFYEFTPVSLCDAFPDSGAKADLLLKQAQGCVLHQSLGVGACASGDLGELRFLLGREMYFHAFKVRENGE